MTESVQEEGRSRDTTGPSRDIPGCHDGGDCGANLCRYTVANTTLAQVGEALLRYDLPTALRLVGEYFGYDCLTDFMAEYGPGDPLKACGHPMMDGYEFAREKGGWFLD